MNLERSSLERLKKRLYSREQDFTDGERRQLRDSAYTPVAEEWKPEEQLPSASSNRNNVMKYTLIGALIFFVGSLVISGFLITKSSPISPKKVRVEVQGPAAIAGGEELTLQIIVKNQNSAAIEDADLIVEFPEGARTPGDLSTPLPRTRESLGTLKPGEEIQKSVQVVLFGEENVEQNVKLSVEYRVSGSSATFSSDEQIFPVVLTSAPLSLRIDSVKEVTSGQSLEFHIDVTSNSESELKDVLLFVEYPFGFTFESASPSPSYRNSVWELGNLKPEQHKKVVLRGKMVGENEEERVFRFSAGNRSTRNETEVGTAYMVSTETVTIKRPFIGVELAIDGSTAAQPTVSRGERVRGDIVWYNNLPTRINDAEISVKLSGDILDERSVSAPRGFYDSRTNTIQWSSETGPDLGELDAGDRGTLTFSFETLSLSAGSTFKDPKVDVVVNIKGKRLSEDRVPESIESSVTRSIKIASDLVLTSRAVYSTGPFKNSGPLPPRAEERTTYTVLWTATNSSNAVSGAVVSASLPSYVKFAERVEPSTADLAFSPVGGSVTWKVGNLAPGARKDVAFQIEFTPSQSQIGEAPILLGEQTIRGTDSFTGTSVGGSFPALTTRISTDPEYQPNLETVE